MAQMQVGKYQTACEASPNKNRIDTWLNENKSCAWISKELLAQYGERISDRSIMKYKKYREDYIKQELMQDPVYQGKMEAITEAVNDGVAKIKEVDLMATLGVLIGDSAELLKQAKLEGVAIRNAQDMRFVAQNMLDAIKVYGDTALKVQKLQAIEDNPELLKPTQINLNVKSTLIDILAGAMQNGDYSVVDQLRTGAVQENGSNEVIDTEFEEVDNEL